MKANYQSVNSFGELCEATGQSIVECRLNGSDIAKVLLSEPSVCLQQATCENGEIKYSGKLLVAFVYEDVSGKLCRAERGAEFFHKAENPLIAPAHTAVGELTVPSVKLRREGGQLIATCIVEAKFPVLGERRHTYVSGGEGLLVQKRAMPIYSQYVATATVEEEDEFECDFAQDILLHTECATVSDVRSGIGQVDVSGETCLRFCLLRADGSLCCYERLTPIKAQVLLDNVLPEMAATAKLRVLSAQVSAATDEEGGRSKIVLSYRVEVEVCAYEKAETEFAVDAYSTEVETGLKWQNTATRYAMNTKTVTERIHGSPILSGSLDGEKTLLAVLCPKVSASWQATSDGAEAQGVIEAKALFRQADGGVEAMDVALPFLFPIELAQKDGEGRVSAELICSVYGFGLRVRAGGETEAEATVKVRVIFYGEATADYLSEVAPGEKKTEKGCAISVYMTSEGEDLWTTAKRLSLTPEQLMEANPSLTFPLKGDERIVIYRQKRENLQK